jgi:hypothetical protein
MRFILALLTLLATPLWADEVTDRLTAEARAMIYAHDIDGFRSAITAAHADDLAAKGDQNLQRALFGPFGVTDPRVAAFTADWLAAEPDSPYALTARVWHLRAMGWAMRGNDLPRYIWPAAMEEMGALHGEAMGMAFRARDLAPDMVAASDAVIRLGQSFGMAEMAEEELARIMAIAPNHGSLIRASNTLDPRWGGSVDAIARACEDYALLIPDVPDYTVDICLVEMFDENRLTGAPQTWSWNKLLELPDHPNLIFARKSMVMGGWIPDPERSVAILDAYLAHGGDPLDIAPIYDHLRQKVSWSAVETQPDVYAAALATATADLAHDPGNTQLVEHYLEMAGRVSPDLQPDTATRVAILEKMLQFAPYDVDGWVSLYFFTAGPSLDEMDAASPAMANAVAYSNHKYHLISTMVAIFGNKYNTEVNRAIRDAGGDPNAAPSPEFDSVVTCPYVRLIQLLENQCTAEGVSPASDECADYPSMADMKADIDHIAARGVCEAERTADIADLFYTPAAAP